MLWSYILSLDNVPLTALQVCIGWRVAGEVACLCVFSAAGHCEGCGLVLGCWGSQAHTSHAARAAHQRMGPRVPVLHPTHTVPRFTPDRFPLLLLSSRRPRQVLLVNLITSVTLGLALAAEPPEPDIMERQPRRRGKRLVVSERRRDGGRAPPFPLLFHCSRHHLRSYPSHQPAA